ncbi:MAG TPA: type II secretion system F family protein [Gemmatimonadaceae bacterium]|nr:type II secretion system F family protein [Gemmatimonadaceae bacterium]
MPSSLAILVTIILGALVAAAWALSVTRSRRQLIGRALDTGDIVTTRGLVLIKPATEERIAERIRQRLPEAWSTSVRFRDKLMQAGFDSPAAVLVFNTIRVIAVVLLPVIVTLVVPPVGFMALVGLVIWAAVAATLIPVWYLNRRVIKRKERIRRSIPDALDLLVVCVESGMSLDAALQRVGRDMQLLHPELAREILLVNRRTSAGVPRDEALRNVWTRTGVEEVRTLVSSMIQSEKWGTSIGRVLRVYAEALRRKRRQTAEKNAAVAPLKMIVPLALMILPALFVVIMGPAVMHISAMLRGEP